MTAKGLLFPVRLETKNPIFLEKLFRRLVNIIFFLSLLANVLNIYVFFSFVVVNHTINVYPFTSYCQCNIATKNFTFVFP